MHSCWVPRAYNLNTSLSTSSWGPGRQHGLGSCWVSWVCCAMEKEQTLICSDGSLPHGQVHRANPTARASTPLQHYLRHILHHGSNEGYDFGLSSTGALSTLTGMPDMITFQCPMAIIEATCLWLEDLCTIQLQARVWTAPDLVCILDWRVKYSECSCTCINRWIMTSCLPRVVPHFVERPGAKETMTKSLSKV